MHYIDNDPVVLRHQRVSALAENENTAFVLADATDVDEILAHPETARLIRPDEPTAALYMTFLHFIPDAADPWGMVRHIPNGGSGSRVPAGAGSLSLPGTLVRGC